MATFHSIARQSRPLVLRLCSRGFGSKRDLPISTPWRRHHNVLDNFVRDFFGPTVFRDVDRYFDRTLRRWENLMTPRVFDAYYVRPRDVAEGAWKSEVSQVKYDKNAFEVVLDVRHYNPEELNVKLVGNRLTLTGKHEQKADEHGFVAREFHREFEVPEDVDLETFKSTLSEDGLLTLRAEVKGVEKPATRTINIERDQATDKNGNKS